MAGLGIALDRQHQRPFHMPPTIWRLYAISGVMLLSAEVQRGRLSQLSMQDDSLNEILHHNLVRCMIMPASPALSGV
jgi:hypothetical protein